MLAEGLPHPMRMQEVQAPDQIQSDHSTLVMPLQLPIAAVREGMSQVPPLPPQTSKVSNQWQHHLAARHSNSDAGSDATVRS